MKELNNQQQPSASIHQMLQQTANDQASIEQLEAVADSVPIHLLHLDLEEKILFVNQAAASWWGLSKEEMIGKSIREVVGEEAHEAIHQFSLRVLNGENVNYESPFIRDGKTYFFYNTYAPFKSHDGKIKGFIATGTEITERVRTENELKRAHEELLAAKAEAEKANRAKSRFLANMSHEIRTPLTAITGFSKILAEEDSTKEERAKYLSIIERNSEQLQRLIDDILDLSKVEAGHMEMEKIPFSLRDILLDVKALLDLKANEKGIESRLCIQGQVPEQVISDPTRLKQILNNLLGNAVKFTKQGRVELTLSYIEKTNKLRFEVKDTGRGLSKEQASILFQAFVQADKTIARQFGGTGLGLVLSKKIAQALGGDVSLLASEPDQGSTFVAEVDAGPASFSKVISQQNF